MTKERFCKDCKHYKYTKGGYTGSWYFPFQYNCLRDVKEVVDVDLVTGKKTVRTTSPLDARDEREPATVSNIDKTCGVSGQFWEAKDE